MSSLELTVVLGGLDFAGFGDHWVPFLLHVILGYLISVASPVEKSGILHGSSGYLKSKNENFQSFLK
jgi:hypothetical protein